MWVGCLPVASVPSWQLTQLPVMLAWSKLAGIQPGRVAVVAVVAARKMARMLAQWRRMPLWQLKQVPMTWVWSDAGSRDEHVLWQSSQMFVVLICPWSFPVASMPLWQWKQSPVMLV